MSTPSPNYVQIPPNSTGLKIRTVEITDSVGNVVECQAIIIADPTIAANLGAVSIFGELSVSDAQNQLLSELVGHTKRVARLLEIMIDQEITLADVD